MSLESAAPELAGTRGEPAQDRALPPSQLAGKLTIKSYESVASIPRAAWERMLPGEPESWDFYSAVESVPPPGFRLGAIAALNGESIVAAAPLFRVAIPPGERTGLSQSSQAMVDKVVSVPRSAIVRRIGGRSVDQIAAIDEALQLWFCL